MQGPPKTQCSLFVVIGLIVVETGLTALLLRWSMWYELVYTCLGLLGLVLVLVLMVSCVDPGEINRKIQLKDRSQE